MKLNKKIKQARELAELTQAELAKVLNVSRATVINWELDRTSPTALQLKEIADACKTGIDFFYQ